MLGLFHYRVVLAISVLFCVSDITTANNVPVNRTVVDLIKDSSVMFSNLLDKANLVANISGPGPFTVFLPSIDALNKLSPRLASYLMSPDGADALESLLSYHIVTGYYDSTMLVDSAKLPTLEGGSLPVKVDGESVNIKRARVVNFDMQGSNGIIHVIDAVLRPGQGSTSPPSCNLCEDSSPLPNPNMQVDPSYTCAMLEELASSDNESCPIFQATAGLYCGCQNPIASESACRICAKNNGSGNGLLPYPAQMVSLGSQFDNGVASCIEAEFHTNSMKDQCPVLQAELFRGCCFGSIAQLLEENSRLAKFLPFVKGANLLDALAMPGNYTVFVPINRAIHKLSRKKRTHLLDPKNSNELMDLMDYHVVNGVINSSSFSNGDSIQTRQGGTIRVRVSKKNGRILVNKGKIVGTELVASNGVIHMIDAVLKPPPII
eukprot:scaffold25990_cov53-Attheya_sp.AAC.3